MIKPLRAHERIGKWSLSVQCSRHHYCSPRTDGLSFEEYDSYEVGIFLEHGSFFKPSNVHPGLKDLDEYFMEDSPGGWVPAADVERIRREMHAHANPKGRYRTINVTVQYGSGTVGEEAASVQIWDEVGPRGGVRRWWRRTGSELWCRTLRDAAQSATGGKILRVRYTR